jgi:glutaredoxin
MARTIHSVVVYSRPGCCLCDDAIDLLRKHGLEPRMINIDADPELQEKFTSCVPVVEIDNVVRFRGRVNEVLLKRLME